MATISHAIFLHGRKATILNALAYLIAQYGLEATVLSVIQLLAEEEQH
jgi:hypothetical protein